MPTEAVKIGLLWRAEWDPVVEGRPVAENSRLRGVFRAFAARGLIADPVIYSDDRVTEVRGQLLELDGVLVWVNPIQDGLDRSMLDPLLRQVSAEGVWVSAHPDVILKMATKEVLVRTREMSWGTDTHLYRTSDELREQLLPRLAATGPRVLKQHRGMGGAGVWKVELVDAGLGPALDDETRIRVQHAERDSLVEELSFAAFADRCERYFLGSGRMIDQPFQDRLAEGMFRVYLTHEKVVGFAQQYPRGLLPPLSGGGEPSASAPTRFEGANAPGYQALRERMESEWVPELQRLLRIETPSLPVIWDADFLYGPRDETGNDSYVLCEINASSTFAFPDQAVEVVAKAAFDRVCEHRSKK